MYEFIKNHGQIHDSEDEALHYYEETGNTVGNSFEKKKRGFLVEKGIKMMFFK